MSVLTKIKDLFVGRRRDASGSSSSVVGAWRVSFISVPHPFGRYDLELHGDGVLAWRSIVLMRDAGEIQVAGSGTWRISGDTLHYTSGESAGALRYSLEGP